MHAVCTGSGDSTPMSPSSVRISLPVERETGSIHDRTARPSTNTVQAPHCPSPQPNRGLFIERLSRRTYRRGQSGSASTVCSRPLIFSEMRLTETSQHHQDRLILSRPYYQEFGSRRAVSSVGFLS